MKLSPTPLTERVEGLDVLRGIALLGIFIANMLHFHSPYIYMDPYSAYTAPHERSMFYFIDVFVEASFYPLFAMLFGYGIAMQYEKSKQSGRNFAPFMARRMAVLLAFGLVHALLIWSGDILVTYALLGFIMIAAVKIPRKWLVVLALPLYIIPASLLYGVLWLARKASPDSMLDGFVDIQQIELAISAYAHGSFLEILLFRMNEFFTLQVLGFILTIFMVLPLIMLGAAFAKYKIVERMRELRIQLIAAVIICIPAGLWLKNIPFSNAPTFENTAVIQSLFGGPVLTIGYAAILLLLLQVPVLSMAAKPFANLGRMAFTTYIMQSVIATLIFYSYGAGLYGKVDIETGTYLALGIYAIQLLFAQVWLSKFRMGPLEALWRRWSYGKKAVKKEESL